MTDTQPPAVNTELVNTLLAQPDEATQIAFLQAADLLNPSGLANLLHVAHQLIRQQPTSTRQVAQLFLADSIIAIVPDLQPQATYLLAQTHAINGRFSTAQTLIEAAKAGYLAQNDPIAALRTNLGLMNVLAEQGNYPAALAAGQQILDAIAADDPTSPQAIPPELLPTLTTMALHNRGVCYEQMGQYEAALTAYQLAESTYQTQGMAEHVAHIRNNRGVILLGLGRGTQALNAFVTAAAQYAQNGSTLLQAKSILNSGTAHLLLGNFGQSLAAFQHANDLLQPLEAESERQIVLLDTATAHLALNLYPEAIAGFREAAAALQASGNSHQQARALWGLGAALTAQGQFEEATAVLNQSLQIFSEIGNLPLATSVMLEQAGLHAVRQQRGLALQAAQAALGQVIDQEWPIQRIYAHLRLADLLLPDGTAVADQLTQAEQVLQAAPLPQLRYRLRQRQGHLALLQNQLDDAQTLLETAVADIEQARGTLAQEMLRASFLRDKTAAYEDLVQLYLKRGDETSLQSAFAIAEQAKSRALVDLLTGLVQTKVETAVDPDVAARLETLQADLNTLYNQALQGGESGERRIRLADLNARAARLEREISRLQLGSGTPVHLPVPDAFTTPISLNEIHQTLPDDVTLLTFFTIGDEILAFVSQQGELRAVRQVASLTAVAQSVQHLQRQWAHFRGGATFVQRNLPLLERSAQNVLAALYQLLIAPLAACLPAGGQGEAPRLAIVPHGLLHQVPFHALYDGQQYLIDRYEISYGPSATILALCQKRPSCTSRKSLIFGVADPEIPAVAAETNAVQALLDDAHLYLNEAATRQTWQAQASGSRVLHMACHGLFRGDNPMFSALKLHDGWLTASDVMQQDLAGALVTLSACESGRSRVLAGDELIGLTRAFLGAGAATLVVSLWLVEDETTAVLMADWYARLRQEKSGATALRQAQLALKQTYPHPYFWAPFVLLGKR